MFCAEKRDKCEQTFQPNLSVCLSRAGMNPIEYGKAHIDPLKENRTRSNQVEPRRVLLTHKVKFCGTKIIATMFQ